MSCINSVSRTNTQPYLHTIGHSGCYLNIILSYVNYILFKIILITFNFDIMYNIILQIKQLKLEENKSNY